MSTQKQEGVAGVVVVVGRCVIAARPHGEAAAILRLNLTPHRPFRMLACAPPSLIATAPPCLSGARRSPTSRMGSRRIGVGSRGARRGQGGGAGGAGSAHRLLGTSSRDRRARAMTGGAGALGRGRRTAFDCQAGGTALAEQERPAAVRGSLG